MSIIIDLIIVGIILLITFVSAKQGFVRTVVGVVGFIAAVVIAFTVSEPLANSTYDNYIGSAIVDAVSDKMSQTSNATTDQIWQSLPEFITDNAERFNFTKQTLDSLVNQTADTQNVVTNISQTVIKPIASQIIKTLFAVIILVVLLFVVKLLAKFLNKLFSFSIVGKLNTALGGALGVLKGALVALIVCEVITLIISFTQNGIWIFNNENIANTILFKFLTTIF